VIRFHLDESVDHGVAERLRARGADITTSTEAGLNSAPDGAQFDYAQDNHRVLVTRDTDFLELAIARPDHWGVVYAYPQRTPIGAIARTCFDLLENFTAEGMRGRVQYVPRTPKR
jgi:hypothetical protein